jgi:hypothetical protein
VLSEVQSSAIEAGTLGPAVTATPAYVHSSLRYHDILHIIFLEKQCNIPTGYETE